MCRKLLLAATVLSIAATPALAAPKKADADAKSAAAVRQKASPADRTAAERMDPIARAAFWARELEIDPLDQDAGLKMAAALRQLGQHEKAAETAMKVTVVNPNNVEAWLDAARGYIGMGQGFYAIDPLKRAQALKPRDWRPASLLGVAYEQTQRPEDAEAAYRSALSLSPDNPSVLANLAMFRAGQGKAEEAEALLRKAAAQPGAGIQVRQNLSLVLGLRGKLDEAERLMRQDLPPEIANNNLAYLRAAAQSGELTPAKSRSWDALQKLQDGG